MNDYQTEFERYYDERVRFWIRTQQLDDSEAKEYAEKEAEAWLLQQVLRERAKRHRLPGGEVDATELV